MSYARFGWGGSDVYVYVSTYGCIECCGCISNESFQAKSTDEMIEHLREHIRQGHNVPSNVIPDLEKDREENEEFIRTGKFPWETT